MNPTHPGKELNINGVIEINQRNIDGTGTFIKGRKTPSCYNVGGTENRRRENRGRVIVYSCLPDT